MSYDYFTPGQVGGILGVTPSTVQAWIRNGVLAAQPRLPGIKLRRPRMKVARAEVERVLGRQLQGEDLDRAGVGAE